MQTVVQRAAFINEAINSLAPGESVAIPDSLMGDPTGPSHLTIPHDCISWRDEVLQRRIVLRRISIDDSRAVDSRQKRVSFIRNAIMELRPGEWREFSEDVLLMAGITSINQLGVMKGWTVYHDIPRRTFRVTRNNPHTNVRASDVEKMSDRLRYSNPRAQAKANKPADPPKSEPPKKKRRRLNLDEGE